MEDSKTASYARLFEAYTHGRGVNLSPREVCALIFDDAVSTAITNAACQEEGIDEIGADEVRLSSPRETWTKFKKRLRKACGE